MVLFLTVSIFALVIVLVIVSLFALVLMLMGKTCVSPEMQIQNSQHE